jgi:hypothetical protein
VCRLAEGPRQVRVAVLGVARPLALSDAEPSGLDQTAVGGEVADLAESPDLSGLVHHRKTQHLADPPDTPQRNELLSQLAAFQDLGLQHSDLPVQNLYRLDQAGDAQRLGRVVEVRVHLFRRDLLQHV